MERLKWLVNRQGSVSTASHSVLTAPQVYQQAETLTHKGDHRAAIQRYQQVLELDPNFVWAHYRLSRIWFWRNELDRSLAAANCAVQLAPSEGLFWAQQGLVLAAKNQPLAGIESCERGIQYCPDNWEVHHYLGEVATWQADYELAEKAYRTAQSLSSESAWTTYGLGWALLFQGRWAESIACFHQAIAQDDSVAKFYYTLVDALILQGEDAPYQLFYDRAVALDPSQDWQSQQSMPADFCAKEYLELNPDLSKIFTREVQAIHHYRRFGQSDGRIYHLTHLHQRPNVAPPSVLSVDAIPLPSPQRLAVFVHVYYIDLWDEIHQYLQNIPQSFDLFVNIVEDRWTEAFQTQVENAYSAAKILVSQNRGRDIGGHLFSMQHVNFDDYDIFCLLHTKKSRHLGEKVSTQWRQDLFDALLATPDQVTENLNAFSRDRTIGLIASRFWRETIVGEANAACYKKFLPQFSICPEARACEFVSGTVMMVRPVIWQRLCALLSPESFEPEATIAAKYKTDGQTAHTVERIIGNIVRNEGMRLFWT